MPQSRKSASLGNLGSPDARAAASDALDTVVAEDALARRGPEEGEEVRRVGEVVQEDAVGGIEELLVEVVRSRTRRSVR